MAQLLKKERVIDLNELTNKEKNISKMSARPPHLDIRMLTAILVVTINTVNNVANHCFKVESQLSVKQNDNKERLYLKIIAFCPFIRAFLP